MITFERSTDAWDGQSDDVDQVLRSYFQSRMPNPWPAFMPPRSLRPATVIERTNRASRWQWHSRLLLIAASVALLLAAKFLLPNYVSTPTNDDHSISVQKSPVDPNEGTAKDLNRGIITDELFFEV